MSLIHSENFDEVAADLQNRVTAFKENVARGFARVDDKIVNQFRDEQLSGRKGDDTGLNIRTGRLHDSIKSLVEVAEAEITGVIFNTDAPYWKYHQYGEGHNPKRLGFDEYFEDQGLQAYTEAVESAFVEFVK